MKWTRSGSAWRVVGGVAGVVVALCIAAGFVMWRAGRVLRMAREEVRAERELRFSVRTLSSIVETSFERVRSPAVFVQAAQFQERLYIAGPAGLLEYDERGNPLREFAVGRELPPSPLVAVAPAALADAREPELLLATADAGLLAFNGRAFRQILPEDSEARAITAILPVGGGHLLIGTRKRGVLLYDGKHLTSMHPTLDKIYVQCLAGSEADFWIGTLEQGVLHWRAGMTETFGEAEGLPDRQVQSIAVAGDITYVGTVTGVAVFDRGRFSRVLAPGTFATALLATPASLIVGTEDQGVVNVAVGARRNRPISNALPGGGEAAANGGQPGVTEVRQLFESDGAVYVLTRSALFRTNARGLGWQAVLQPGGSSLTDRNISALAADGAGRLWVGYFDRGLDILQADGGASLHVENEHVFCVNRILADGRTGNVAVATANGLVRFDAAAKQQQVLTRVDGLIADHVTDLVAYRDGLALATPSGLTFLDRGGARSMYAFHGLVNNHVYSLAVAGDELMVGTLGGVSVIDGNSADRDSGSARSGEHVKINYTAAATSGMKHNWITSVVRVGDEWMVGTYGAGVLGVDDTGNFRGFEGVGGDLEINPNAMLVTPRFVLAGSLGHGLFVYDRGTARWRQINSGLPSLNVTAFAASNGYIYVGTDNGLVKISEQKLQP